MEIVAGLTMDRYKIKMGMPGDKGWLQRHYMSPYFLEYCEHLDGCAGDGAARYLLRILQETLDRGRSK
jgi:hypothetical protein